MKLSTISNKILLWLTPFFIAILAVSTFLIDNKMNSQIRNDIQIQSKSDAQQLSKLIEEYQNKALETALYIANNDKIIEAYQYDDEQAVKEIDKTISPLISSITKENNLDDYKIHFHRPPAKSLYRIWSKKRNDDLSSFRKTILNVNEKQKPLKAIELGKGGFAIRGIAPIFNGEEYIGSVEMFYNPMDIISILTGSDTTYSAFYLVNKEAALSLFLPNQIKENYAGEVNNYIISKVKQQWVKPKSIVNISIIDEVLRKSEIATDISDNTAVSYIPLKDFSGKTIGIMTFVQDISSKIQAVTDFIWIINIVLSILIIVLYIALILVIRFNISRKLSVLLEANKSLEIGNLEYFKINAAYKSLLEKDSKDEIGQLVSSYSSMVSVQTNLLDGIDLFTKEIDNGNLSFRNSNKLEGVYAEILQKINSCIDVMVEPIDITIDYLEKISQGQLPKPIGEKYRGDFERIRSALNLLILSISSLNDEFDAVYKNQTNGIISYKAPEDKYSGFYRELLAKTNESFGQLDMYISNAISISTDYANGNLENRMKQLPGELGNFSNAINKIGSSVGILSDQINDLSKSISNGLLDVRAEEMQVKGQFRVILNGLNQTLDAVIHPLNVTAEYIDRISKGDIPSRITEEYKGDFNEIKNNINLCIDSLSLMLNDVDLFVSEISIGKLRYRVQTDKLSGDFNKIMNGLNSSMDSVVSLLDSIEAPLMSIDKDFNILFMNEQGSSLDKKHGADLEGSKCYNHFKTDHCKTDNCACHRTMLSNLPEQATTVARPGIHELDIVYNGVPIKDSNNNTIGAFEIVFDQTEVKRQIKVNEKVAKYQVLNTEQLIHSLEMLSNGNTNSEFVISDPNDLDLREAFNNFNKISIALSNSMQSISDVLAGVDNFVTNAEKGNLKYRIDTSRFKGDYQQLVKGVNNILENVLAPINESLSIIEEMEAGNLNQFMIGEYEGDYLVLKEKQNSLIISLNKVLSEVVNIVEMVDDSTNIISNNTDALAAATLEQSSQSDEVASAVEELSATITQNAISSLKTSELATNNGDLAVEGGNIVSETILKMKDIAGVVADSATQIEQLGKASSKIGEIISVIDEIADQTNLLALNAAIEAARAGEQGRGFAVVADEVRKLAERTSDATKQISSMIIDVQNETSKAVEAMHRGTKEVNGGITFADKAGDALKKIVNSSTQLKDMVNQMASANEEQSATSEQISKNIASISQVSSESAKRIEGVSNMSDQLKTMTTELATAVSRFNLSSEYRTHQSGANLLNAVNYKQKQ